MCPSCGALVDISSMSFSGINWGNEANQSIASQVEVPKIPVVEPRQDTIVKTQIDSVKIDVDTTKVNVIKKTAAQNDVTQNDAAQIEAVQKLATVLNLIREKKIAEIQAAVKARNNGEGIVASKVERVAEIPPEVDLQHQLFSMLGHQLSQEDLEGKLREEHEKLLHEERERQLQEELKQWRAKREASQQRWREEQGRQASQQRWREQQERQAKRREEEKRQALENIKRERLEKNRIEQEQAAADPPSSISKLKTKISDKWNGLFYGMSEGEKTVRIIKFVLIIVMAILAYFAEKDREYHSYEQAHKRWEVVEKGLENYHPEDELDDKLKSLLNGQPPSGFTVYEDMFEEQGQEDVNQTEEQAQPEDETESEGQAQSEDETESEGQAQSEDETESEDETPLEDETQAEEQEQTEDQIQDNSQGEDY